MADSNSENNQIIIDADIAFSDESECSDIERSAAEAIEKTLPKKSKLNYEKVYKKFCGWCEEKRVKVISENVMLCYFNEKSKIMKSSTVWSEYSKLKCMIYKERRVDISKFHGLIAFLKRNGVGHVAKKSSILTGDDFNKFIMEADDDKFLMMKAALIIGIGGGCRRAELAKMSVKDVVDRGDYLHVYIGDTKNYDPRDFAITEGGLRYNLLGIVRKYMLLRKSHTPHDRFFVCYRNGQCTTQAVGINTVGAIVFIVFDGVQLHCWLMLVRIFMSLNDSLVGDRTKLQPDMCSHLQQANAKFLHKFSEVYLFNVLRRAMR
ncbi:uncharacterized protein LOC119070305 [Bradysia coprophila]|uniref:uncharacterized protein LOC119070305 n=1 Tax=Bradysia coprophila TaxID=38358 RepID=UPI00187D8DE8|nr:uncharacterized protein LOC119070305 [Bradysia coprophila]